LPQNVRLAVVEERKLRSALEASAMTNALRGTVP
jgi:hypothetical protein